jgi:hypothetical protein
VVKQNGKDDGKLRYDYKCPDCGLVKEFFISTADIPHKKGAIMIYDKDELQRRIDEERFCECGGKFRRVYSTTPLDVIHIPENCDYISNGSTHRTLQKGGTSGFNSKLRS